MVSILLPYAKVIAGVGLASRKLLRLQPVDQKSCSLDPTAPLERFGRIHHSWVVSHHVERDYGQGSHSGPSLVSSQRRTYTPPGLANCRSLSCISKAIYRRARRRRNSGAGGHLVSDRE